MVILGVGLISPSHMECEKSCRKQSRVNLLQGAQSTHVTAPHHGCQFHEHLQRLEHRQPRQHPLPTTKYSNNKALQSKFHRAYRYTKVFEDSDTKFPENICSSKKNSIMQKILKIYYTNPGKRVCSQVCPREPFAEKKPLSPNDWGGRRRGGYL